MHIYNPDKAETTVVMTNREFLSHVENARNGGINDAWELAKKWAKLNKSLGMSAEDAFLEAEREEQTEQLLAAVTKLKDQLSKTLIKVDELIGRLENHVSMWG